MVSGSCEYWLAIITTDAPTDTSAIKACVHGIRTAGVRLAMRDDACGWLDPSPITRATCLRALE